MTIDLTQLTAGQIALLTASATLLAAIIAGSFALVVAWVNGFTARRIARANSRRDFRLRVLEPFLNSVGHDIQYFQDELGKLGPVGSLPEWDPDADSGAKTLFMMATRIEKRQRSVDITRALSLVTRKPSLGREVQDYLRMNTKLDSLAKSIEMHYVGLHYAEGDNKQESMNDLIEDLTALGKHLGDMVASAVVLHASIEDHIFE